MMLRDSNRHLEEENAALREENARLRAELYGKKSERTVASDIDITIEEVPAKEEPKPTAADATQQNKTDKPAKRTRRLRVHYTREIEETLIPDEVKAAPADYERLPESAERVSLRVEIVPAHLALHIYRCPAFVRVGKRGRKKQEAPIRAASPASILPGSNIGNSIIALLLYNKHVLKLPLYRQIREFERLSILNLSEGVLCNWVRGGADAMERREMLESWLYDPNIPIDNNTAERAVRPVTIGRKNSLFIGAPEAGQRSAILYTMMEECKRCKIDSLAWLTWVLERLPNYRGDYRDLYPSAMPQPQETVKERTI